MFTTTAAAPLNGSDDAVRLTPDQVWTALEMRARGDDERFCPPELKFEVTEDHGDWLIRKIEHAGHGEGLQKITNHGNRLQIFDFLAGFQTSNIICAIEADDEGEYWLRFTWLSRFTGMDHQSDAEKAMAAEARPIMKRQPAMVVAVARELVTEGRI